MIKKAQIAAILNVKLQQESQEDAEKVTQLANSLTLVIYACPWVFMARILE